MVVPKCIWNCRVGKSIGDAYSHMEESLYPGFENLHEDKRPKKFAISFNGETDPEKVYTVLNVSFHMNMIYY
ncbi:hypothetical protein CS542_03715 [Pedobacter sp. IW39]|nr:hypothetical protein CS542_03715 [Pedobacter sp. IW39]